MMPLDRITRSFFPAALLAAALLTVPALAVTPALIKQDAPTLVHMDLSVTAAMKNALSPSFDTGQINMLKSVAHQQAVVIACAGFTVDQKRLADEISLAYDDTKGKPKVLTVEQKATLEKRAMFGLGMALGSQLSIAAYDEKSFCAGAERERATLGFKHGIWVKQVRD